jgi:phosphoglycolate phosphatase
MIQYVLFDFDGTLADSKAVALSILNQLAEKYGFNRITPSDLESLRKLSIPEKCRFLNLPLYKIPLLAATARVLYKDAVPALRPFDGIKNLLKTLQMQGIQPAILSSNSEPNIRAFLHHNAIDAITIIHCSHDIFGKDAVIRRFLKAHRLSAAQVVYVGDEQRDVTACRKCGVRVIWVSWGYDSLEAAGPAGPDFIAHTPEELLRIVLAAGT